MTSFAVRAEPAPTPRLAAAALAVHLAAATGPWVALMPALPAAMASAVALASLAWTLAALPGPHCPLSAVTLDRRGLRLRLRGAGDWRPATLGSRSRAYAGLVLLDARCGSRRFAWLLTRASLPPAAFRRLKSRIRLAC